MDPEISVAPQQPQTSPDAGGKPKLIEIDRSKLSANAADNVLFKFTDTDGKPHPVFVEVGMGRGRDDAPKARMGNGPDGKYGVIINEGYHKLDEAYVRENLMLSRENFSNSDPASTSMSVQDVFADLKGKPGYDAAVKEYDALIATTKANEAKKGRGDVDVIVMPQAKNKDGTPDINVSDGYASELKEGNRLITVQDNLVRDAVLTAKGRQQFEGVIGHEDQHLAHGDYSAAGMIRNHNVASANHAEARADLGTDNPAGLQSYLTDKLTDVTVLLNKDNNPFVAKTDGTPGREPTAADLKQTSDAVSEPTHPDIWKRIAALEVKDALDLARGNLAKRHVPEETPAEQSRWVTGEVMQQMQSVNGRALPDPASLTSPQGLPEDIKAKLKAMTQLPMKEVDAHAAPAAPAPEKDISVKK